MVKIACVLLVVSELAALSLLGLWWAGVLA